MPAPCWVLASTGELDGEGLTRRRPSKWGAGERAGVRSPTAQSRRHGPFGRDPRTGAQREPGGLTPQGPLFGAYSSTESLSAAARSSRPTWLRASGDRAMRSDHAISVCHGRHEIHETSFTSHGRWGAMPQCRNGDIEAPRSEGTCPGSHGQEGVEALSQGVWLQSPG